MKPPAYPLAERRYPMSTHSSTSFVRGFTAFLALSTFSVSIAWAQPCDPNNNCVNCGDQSERLKCKFDRVANKGKRTMELLEGVPGLLTPAQAHGMTIAKERMDREKVRTKPEDFKLLAKKKSANCQLLEASGNGDGVCDPNTELCAEVLKDGIGNDDGICSPLHGTKREVCVQICDEEAVLLDDSALDDNAVAELEGMYDTLAGHLEEVNETVPETAALMQTLATVTLDDPCVLQTTLKRNTYDTYKKAKWAAMGSRAAADVAERFCDQNYGGFWFSFTVGAACVVAEAAVLGLNVWWDTVDVVEAELDAIGLDATIACARQSARETNNTGEMIQGVRQTLSDVRSQNQEILGLVKMPPGQRTEYPKP